MRFASPDDIQHALASETGDPSAAAVMVFDRIPADFLKTVSSSAAFEGSGAAGVVIVIAPASPNF
jgi:hypothetical protein